MPRGLGFLEGFTGASSAGTLSARRLHIHALAMARNAQCHSFGAAPAGAKRTRSQSGLSERAKEVEAPCVSVPDRVFGARGLRTSITHCPPGLPNYVNDGLAPGLTMVSR